MPSTDNSSTERRDPRAVAVVLVAVVGVLALLFPKPDRAPAAQIDPMVAPNGYTLHSLADADVSTCLMGSERKASCKLLGISEEESVSLTLNWATPMGEEHEAGTPVEVVGARLLLIENHHDDYQGPLLLEGTIEGARIDPRTFRFPAEGTSAELDALLSKQLSAGPLTLSISPTAATPSSIDEFTPSLELSWRIPE
ncbi:MAG: hypothetical protein P8R54_01775 [Myxococcota bacterium]|nr:hypothetical protein [Myxococcota bacterium]